jgi:hypothetical protein
MNLQSVCQHLFHDWNISDKVFLVIDDMLCDILACATQQENRDLFPLKRKIIFKDE